MSRGASRTFILENQQDEAGNVYHYREQAEQLVSDLLATLDSVGGMFSVASRRVELPGPPGVTLAETVGVIVEWKLVAPLERLPKNDPPAEADVPHEHAPAPAGEPALEPDGDEWADDDDLLLSQDPDEASIVAAGEPA